MVRKVGGRSGNLMWDALGAWKAPRVVMCMSVCIHGCKYTQLYVCADMCICMHIHMCKSICKSICLGVCACMLHMPVSALLETCLTDFHRQDSFQSDLSHRDLLVLVETLDQRVLLGPR